ncbi:hypothetical protein NPIL_255631, partial [Nephila pilipes]
MSCECRNAHFGIDFGTTGLFCVPSSHSESDIKSEG